MSDDPQGQDPAEDDEPDVRFTYANERTFLAWNRTALALIATGVAATQLLPEFHVAGGRQILGIPLIALGALVAVTSFQQWRANEKAMRSATAPPEVADGTGPVDRHRGGGRHRRRPRRPRAE